jgi:hypothetical protein
MPSTHSDASRSGNDIKQSSASWSILSAAWSEFQLAVLLSPDFASKKIVLSSIEQANRFYHQRDISAMQQVISLMVEEMKIRLLPLKIKEKANDLGSLLKEDHYFEKEKVNG